MTNVVFIRAVVCLDCVFSKYVEVKGSNPTAASFFFVLVLVMLPRQGNTALEIL